MEKVIEELEWAIRGYEANLDKLRKDMKRSQEYVQREQEALARIDTTYLDYLDRIAELQKAIRKLREVENG